LAAPAAADKRRRTRGIRRYPVFSLSLLLLIVIVAVFAGVLASHPPGEQSLIDRFQPPVWADGGSWTNPLGTDALGRDVLSRLMHGARSSLLVAFVSIGIGASAGTAVALAAGHWRGTWIDTVLMRITDAALSLPIILVALLFAVAVGPSLGVLVTIVALFIWARTARIVRGEVLQVSAKDYVTLARVSGASHLRIIVRYLLPNVAHVAIVVGTLEVGAVIILEASLSFLGVGVPPPAPSWGSMIADGRDYLGSAWWLTVAPGAMIMITVMSLNFLGDWLRDRLDPHAVNRE
jgi:peptide/nickel transport system permease protein